MIIKNNSIPSKKQVFIMLAFLVLVTIVFYLPSLFYDFLYELDDDWIVVSNNSIKIISIYGWKTGLAYLFFMDTTDFHYHPITYLSLSLDYILFGLNATAIKAHNLFLHITSGILLFWFINLLVKQRWIAFIVALLFLIHPMNIESIAWASCRRQALFFCYFLASLIVYKIFLENRYKKYKNWLYFLSIVFWILSTLAKASAIVMPAVFVLLYIHEKRDTFRSKTMVKHILPMLPLLLLFVHLNEIANARNFLVRNFSYSNFDHLIFAGYTYCFYWVKALFPFPLVYFYPAPSEHLPHQPIAYFIMFAGSCLLILLMIYHFLKRQNTLFFALGFYTLTILPMLNLMYYPLGDLPMLVSNRYFYHTSLGILLYIVLVVHYTVRNRTKKIIIASLYFVLLGVLFKVNLPVWKNQITMLENAAKYYPSEDILYKLAMVYDDSGETKNALLNLNKADTLGTDIWINYPWSYYQKRSNLYLKSAKYDKALEDINTALQKKQYKTPADDSVLLLDKKNIEILIQSSTSMKP